MSNIEIDGALVAEALGLLQARQRDSAVTGADAMRAGLELLTATLRGDLTLMTPDHWAAYAREWNSTVEREALQAAEWAADIAGAGEWRVEAMPRDPAALGPMVQLRLINRLDESKGGVGVVDTYKPGQIDPDKVRKRPDETDSDS